MLVYISFSQCFIVILVTVYSKYTSNTTNSASAHFTPVTKISLNRAPEKAQTKSALSLFYLSFKHGFTIVSTLGNQTQ